MEVIDNTITDVDPLKLEIHANLELNSGVKIDNTDDIYQITQIKEKSNVKGVPVTEFGARKINQGFNTNEDLLDNEIVNFKSTDIKTIVFGKDDNLEKLPSYMTKISEYNDAVINKHYKKKNKIDKNMFNIKDLDLLDEDIFNENQAGGSNSNSNSSSNSSDDFDPEAEAQKMADVDQALKLQEAEKDNEAEKEDDPQLNLDEDINVDIDPERPIEEGEEEEEKEVEEEKKGEEGEGEEVEPEELDNEDEFVIDDFEVEDIDVVINEEEIIPEEKIISNENDQKNDLFNELMKMEDSNKRAKIEYINKNEKLLNRFSELKNEYSKKNENNEIISHKEKGDKYKQNTVDFMNGNFNNKNYIPLVKEIKKIYLSPEREEAFENKKNKISFNYPDNSEVVNDIENITNICNIRTKYRKGTQRINYSYINELNESYNSDNAYIQESSVNGYETVLKDSTLVVRNCFDEADCMVNGFDSHKLNGEIRHEDDLFVEGNNVTITGIVKLPEDYVDDIELNKTLLECVNYKPKIIKKKQLIENLSIETIDLSFNIGDKIKVCFNEKTKNFNIIGNIIDIEDNGQSYIIKPDDTDIKNLGVLKINKRDTNIVFEKDDSIMKIGDNERLCFNDQKNKFLVYLFPENPNIEQVYNNIFPDQNLVINTNYDNLKNVVNIEEVNDHLKQYNIHTDNITYNNFKLIADTLNYNVSNILKESIKNRKAYNIFLKNSKSKQKKLNFVISNSSLEEVAKYYGQYPFYNQPIDSNQTRFNWLYKTYDNGYFYFKSIVKKIQGKLSSFKDKTTSILDSKIYKLENKVRDINRDIINLSRDKKNCPEYRLVKLYTKHSQIEEDNIKEYVEIDKDKIVKSERTNIVAPGQYAILQEPNKNTLFKRTELPSGKQMWIREDGENIDRIIKTNQEFCINQNRNIDNLKLEDIRCMFSENEGCVPKEIVILENEKISLEEEISELRKQKEELSMSELSIKNLDKDLETHKKMLLSKQSQRKRKYEYDDKLYKDVLDKYADEENKSLYLKIDKYLENISKLEKTKYYEGLEVLLNKYGRNAHDTNENQENIYCVKGKKVLFCKHNLHFIELYKNFDLKSKDSEEICRKVIENYGIEADGKYWCRNCGQEIGTAEYEIIEGFDKTSGAHIVTHEELDEDEDEENAEDEMFKALQVFINEKNMQLEGDNSVNIIKIMQVFLDLMGIKLKPKDELDLLQQCDVIDKTITSKKGRTALLIINIACCLFIKLQISIPSYKAKKAHGKCIVSLQGYPLEEDTNDMRGIEYICCLIDSLKDSGSEYKELKKIKNTKKTFLKILESLLKDEYISYSYKLKRDHLLKQLEKDAKLMNTWKEFKPPLSDFNINLTNLAPLEVDTTDITVEEFAKLKENFKEKLSLLSYKFIEIINVEINNSNVENKMFTPTPIDNFCCLSTINEEYEYINFFSDKSNKTQKTILNSIKEMETNRNNVLDNPVNNSQNVYPNEYFKKLPTFKDNILPSNEQITSELIRKLHLEFISDGENIGKKHVYDENNICTETGIKKEDIIKNNYTLQDYEKLMNNINIKKQIKINSGINVNINPLLKILENKELDNIDYFKSIITSLEKKDIKISELDDILNDFTEQLNVEIDELVGILTTNLYDKKSEDVKNLTNIIKNLGSFTNIYEENKVNLGDNVAEKIFYKEKTIALKRYINLTKNILLKIINLKPEISQDKINFIKQNMKLQDKHLDKLKKIFENNHNFIMFFQENMTKSENKEALSSMYNYLKNNTENMNFVVGKDHSIDCKNKVTKISNLTHKGASLIIHYIFVKLLVKIVSLYKTDINREIGLVGLDDDEDDPMSGGSNPDDGNLNLEEDIEETQSPDKQVIDIETQKVKGDLTEVEDVTNLLAHNLEDDEVDLEINSKLIENKNMMINNFVFKMLILLGKNNEFIDNYTTKHVNEIITTQYENEKEANLKFIEELDKESRQSFKALVAMGVESYKSLSSKKKELYMSGIDPLQEITEEEINGDIPLSEDEKDSINRNKAKSILGDKYDENAYQDWLNEKNHHDIEDQLAYNEFDQLSDDDE